MVIAYWIGASVTATLLIRAFFKDKSAKKVSLDAWMFIAIATLIWPVTLPFIISSKLRMAKAAQSTLLAEGKKRYT